MALLDVGNNVNAGVGNFVDGCRVVDCWMNLPYRCNNYSNFAIINTGQYSLAVFPARSQHLAMTATNPEPLQNQTIREWLWHAYFDGYKSHFTASIHVVMVSQLHDVPSRALFKPL